MNVSRPEAMTRLSRALGGRRCVTAWLGYGEVLFLGLGDEVLPARDADGNRSRPTFQLATHAADWSADGPTCMERLDADRAAMTRAAESLIGQPIISWEWLENHELRLVFTDRVTLSIEPWPETDYQPDQPWTAPGYLDDCHAWSLSDPDGKILAMAPAGRTVVVDERMPIKDWFRLP